ncbi:MAG: FKBP-type peptidyl-prolyl cis-trans isomerase [Bacteroidales bacterium]|nr:FKBP-type peptidyl-prolyl cis-trans isomerase [Bacteroidales bacterium]
MNSLLRYLFIICVLSMGGCHEETKPNEPGTITVKELKEPLIKTNKYLTRTEKEDIDDLIHRYKWNMNSTGTGLLYFVEDKKSDKKAVYGNIVSAKYIVKLINGEVVYDSEKDGLLEFQVGKGGIPAGIEEGILLIGLHDKAKFILPSHLAYGLLGDSKRIPPRSVLIYEIEIINLQ